MEGPETRASKSIASGKYVVLWGVDTRKFLQARTAAETILAYERETPEQGGLVVTVNGTVKGMTAADFQAAPKAKGM